MKNLVKRGPTICSARRVVALLVLVVLVTSLLTSLPLRQVYGSFDPWASGWQYRSKVTLDHTKVSATLTNFPVLIDVTSSNLASKAQANGNDILFMDGGGSASKLDHQIESYTSGTGHLVAWVRIPTLSSTADTVFYMYYGNPSASNQQNPTGVWDSRFVMVQHLDHIDQASGKYLDSTAHHNDGTATASGVSQSVGKFGGAGSFDGVNGRVDVPDNLDNSLNFGTAGFTLSIWIKYTDCGDTDLTRKGNMASSPQMSYKMECSSNLLTATLEGSNPGGGGSVSASTPNNDNNWHNDVFMRNAGTISLYVDGALKASQGGAGMDLTSTAMVGIGAKPPPISPGGDFFTGGIDEVRYSNVALGSDWILTSYRSATQQFVTYGAEEQNLSTTYDFSFVWMSDTQFYSASYPATYDAMAQWVVNNQVTMKIQYVAHTGDIVDDATSAAQWQNAAHSMGIINGAGIPWGVLEGNHDETDGSVNYHTNFGSQIFAAKPYYHNDPTGNNDNHYDLITSNGVNFVIVYLSYGSIGAGSATERAWASNVFQTYHNRIGILATHEYIGSGGGYSGDGSAVNTDVVLPNSNVWLVLCGHIGGAQLNVKTVGSRTYYELLSDYQELANGGNGYEKIFYFDLAHSNVHVKTYSASLAQWGGSGYGYEEFDMALPQQSQNGPTVTVTGAYHGARLSWTNVGALSYNIYYNLANSPDSATQFATGITAVTYDVTNLPSNTWGATCYYWVAPVSSGGEAAKSSWGSGSDLVWMYKIEILPTTQVVKTLEGDVKVHVEYRSRYLGSEGITVGVQVGEYLGPGPVGNIPNRMISLVSTRPIALVSFMSTGEFNFESSSGEFVKGSSFKAWIFLWNQLPSDPGYWEAYADKAELIPITIP